MDSGYGGVHESTIAAESVRRTHIGNPRHPSAIGGVPGGAAQLRGMRWRCALCPHPTAYGVS